MSRWRKKRKVMQRYDATANIYDLRYAEEQAAKYDVILKSQVSEKLGLVLDVGCGTGLLFGRIADKAEATLGLDLSKKNLLIARRRGEGLRNVHVIRADAGLMPFKRSIFNQVFAMTVIQNLPDPTEILDEVKRVSTDDAMIIVTGLKRIFAKENFTRLVSDAGLRVATLKDEDNIKCFVAICLKIHH